MSYVGDFALESTFDVKFTSRQFTTGAPFALASGVISAYPGNSTTQLTAGITLTADFDTVTGLNNVRVVATSANGYAADTNYALVITTGTVDSVSVVGEVIGHFSIENRSAYDIVASGTHGNAALKTLIDTVDTVADAILVDTGTTLDARIPAALVSGRMDSSVGAMAANVMTAAAAAADLTTELQTGLATAAALATAQTDLDAIEAAVITNAAGVDIAADIIAMKADTAAILVDTGTTLDGRIPAALTAGGNIKADVLAISGSTVSADNLEESTEAIGYGTCDTGGSTTTVIASSITPASAVNDQYNGRVLIFKNDTTTTALRGQATTISDFVHATQTFTVVALTTAPATGDTFTVL